MILDEPTNHMDIVGKETLERMLKDFSGSVLFVSHDRYFVSQIADSLLIFEEAAPEAARAATRYYPYSYTQYQQEQNGKPTEADLKKGIPADPRQIKQQASAPATPPGFNPGKERSRLTKKLERIEAQISICEEELQTAKDELLNPEYASDYGKLSEIQQTITAKEQELDNFMYEWGTLTTQLEEL